MLSYRIIRAITEIYVVLCLLGPFEQAASLQCYFCAGTNAKSPCLDAGYYLEGIKDTDGKPQMLKNCTAPYNHSCIIEEYAAGDGSCVGLFITPNDKLSSTKCSLDDFICC